MKTIQLILLALISALAFSCKDGDDWEEYPADSIEIGDEPLGIFADRELYFNSEGSERQLYLHTLNQWEMKNVPSWLHPDKTSGMPTLTDNSEYISIFADPNPDIYNRIAVFSIDIINSCWKHSLEIKAEQYSAAPFVTLIDDHINASGASGSVIASIKTNYTALSFKASSSIHTLYNDIPWITSIVYDKTKGGVVLTLAPNVSDIERKAYVHVYDDKGQSYYKYITVIQSPSSIHTISKLIFSPDGGSHSVSVESDVDWTLSCEDSWVQISPASGKAGTTELTIDVDTTYLDGRSGYVRFTKTGNNTDSFVLEIEQSGRWIAIHDKNKLTFTSDKSSISMYLEAYGEWEIMGLPTWLSANPSKSFDNTIHGATITLTVEPNTSIYERAGDIVFGYRGHPLTTVTVTQEGMKSGASTDELTCNWKSTTIPLSIISPSARWNALVSTGWISLSKYSGFGDEDITVSISKNPNDATRTGIITINYADGTMTKDVTVTQTGQYLTVSEQTGEFSIEGGSIAIYVNTDYSIDCEIVYDGEMTNWLSWGISRSEIPLVLTAIPNNSGYERNAVFRVKAVDNDANEEYRTGLIIPIRQAGRRLISSMRKITSYAAGGTSSTCVITADGDFSLNAEGGDWFELIQIENTFYVIFKENTSSSTRSGKIVATLLDTPAGETFTIEIPVVQYSPDTRVQKIGVKKEADLKIRL